MVWRPLGVAGVPTAVALAVSPILLWTLGCFRAFAVGQLAVVEGCLVGTWGGLLGAGGRSMPGGSWGGRLLVGSGYHVGCRIEATMGMLGSLS